MQELSTIAVSDQVQQVKTLIASLLMKALKALRLETEHHLAVNMYM